MNQKAQPEKATTEAAPSRRGWSGLFAVALSVVNLGATGFLVLKVLELSKPAEAAASAEEAAAPPAPGPVADLPTFVVNLDEPGLPRYLKTTVSLQLRDAEVLSHLEQAKAEIRDLILRYLSTLRIEDTRGEEGKARIQRELLARVKARLGEDEVSGVFFGEFVVQ